MTFKDMKSCAREFSEFSLLFCRTMLLFTTSAYAQQSVFELSSIDGTNGFIAAGCSSYDGGCAGNSVASGDINGNGVTDLIISGSQSLLATVYGAKNGLSSFSMSNYLDGSNGFFVERSVCSVASGDINGDGIADLISGGCLGWPRVEVIYGTRNGFESPFSPFYPYAGGGDSDGFSVASPEFVFADSPDRVLAIISIMKTSTQPEWARTAAGLSVASGDINGDGVAA